MSGDTAVVGAIFGNAPGQQGAGSAYIYNFGGASIPAVSEWGLLVMALLVLAAGTLVNSLRRRAIGSA